MSYKNFIFSLTVLMLGKCLSAQDLNMQNGTVNQCSGTFFDSGGSSGNYGDNEDFTLTICPDMPNMLTVLNFVELQLAADGSDSISIYDRDSVVPSSLIGTYTGDLTSNPELTDISATLNNPSGCLTIVFLSNSSSNEAGWEANVSCLDSCPTLNPGLDFVSPTNFDGENYLACYGDVISFDANVNLTNGNPGLVTYTWDFDNGSTGSGEIANTIFPEPGFYDVTLTVSYPDCPSESIVFPFQVGTDSIIELSAEVFQVCAGEMVELTAEAESTPYTALCGEPVSTPTPLPDGTGASYSSQILVECFDAAQTITDINDINQVCLNLEHSFLGDLEIILIAPDGQQVVLKQISNFPASEDVFLGDPVDDDTGAPGVGFQYCFTTSAAVTLPNGPTVDVANPDDPANPNQSIEPGSYLPSQSFTNLTGSPLNGNWTIQITDNITIDDGWIFEWFIDFNLDIIPEENIFQPVIIKEEWIGFEGQGSVIEVTQITEGEQCYEYQVIDSYGCTYIEEICIEYLPVPFIGPVEDLYLCDEPNQESVFNLSANNALALGNQDPTENIITYHETIEDAELGENPINPPNAYTPPQTPATVYVRLEQLENGCYRIRPFNLIDSVFIGQPNDLQTCSIGGSETFNLTSQNGILFGPNQNNSSHSITFHDSETNAEFGINAIQGANSYTVNSTSETIWVRIEDNGNDQCYNVTSFNLIVNEQPEILSPALDLSECAFIGLTFDLTINNVNQLSVSTSINSNVTYHNTQFDANSGINEIANPENYNLQSSLEVIWVRVENEENEDCYDITSFTVQEIPTLAVNINPDPFVVCDDDNDGFFNSFDLDAKGLEISFGNPIVDLTYHLTEQDANNNVGALNSPYANVVENSQTIYFRTEDTDSGCIQIGELDLIVVNTPLLTPIDEPIIACDDDGNGVELFDLTIVENDLLGNLNPDNVDLTYHLTQNNAINATGAIAVPTSYQNISNPQTLWVRSTDTSNGVVCFDVLPIEIQVSNIPNFTFAEPFAVCDDEAGGDLGDEIALFDFNEVIDEITQVNNELLVEFFESQADLDNNQQISPIDSYQNISNPQTIFVKITSGTTGCIQEASLTIVVEPTPSLASELDPLEICDPDNDGFAEFDLAAEIPDILNNEPDVTITFHLTQASADLGSNPIDVSQPFGTNNPNQQTLFVRAENTGPNGNDGSGCYDTRPLDLIVLTSPEIQDLSDLSLCEDGTPNGIANFDLTENNPIILGNLDPNMYTISYHETQSDAETGINPIAVPSNYTNLTNPQTIFVRFENPENGCYDLYNSSNDVNNSFTLTVEPVPEIFPPSTFSICDDNNNLDPFPQTTFDLTEKEAEIANVNIVPENLEFTYFETLADLENDVNPIADPTNYSNLSQPQDIFVKVTDTSTEGLCYDFTILIINVLPLPTPSETDPDVLRIEICDDDNDGIAAVPFDLTISGVLMSESENVSISYYTSESGASFQDVDDLISDPTAYVNEPSLNITDDTGNPTNVQIIYARVDNNVSGNFCFVIVPFEIVVLPAPQLNPEGDPFAYTLCEDDNSNPGLATIFSIQDITNHLWDLSNGSSDQIIPLLDPNFSPAQDVEDFEITYHETVQDAEDGINSIPPGYLASDGQLFYIRVSNIETNCYNTNLIGVVQIMIEPRPAISDEGLDNLEVCADDIGIPEVASIDLTVQDLIINPNDPNQTTVVYYEGMTNYNNGIAIEDPSNFTTSQTPQTIIAEVVNNLTLCESATFVNFEILVRPLPNLDLSEFDGLVICYDENGNLIENETSPPTIETGLSGSNFSFEWELDGVLLPVTTSSYTLTEPGLYSVTATNLFSGCQVTSTATIVESVVPNFEVLVISSAFSANQSVEVTVIGGTGNFEFQLDDGEWISLPAGQNSLTFTNVSIGTHIIRGRDQGGCGAIEQRFTIIDYPEFFTPNEDGINDTWNIVGLNQPDARLYIYDRYGKLLKQLKPDGIGWDGTFNGKPMPSQSYWFRIDFREPLTNQPTTFRAHFVLKR